MPKLEKIEFYKPHVIEADCLDFGIENLPCLNTVKCIYDCGNDDIIEAVKTALKRAVSAHPTTLVYSFRKDLCGLGSFD